MCPPLLQVAQIANIDRNNAFGDEKLLSYGPNIPCKFRDATDYEDNRRMQQVTSNFLGWFAPDAGITDGDILLVEGYTYKVTSVILARDLDTTDVHFIKVTLDRYNIHV